MLVLRAIAIFCLLYACAIFHEGAHIWAARRLGLPHNVHILPGRMGVSFTYARRSQAIAMALAGLLAEGAFAGLFYVLGLPWEVPLVLLAGHLLSADGWQLAAALVGRFRAPALPGWWRWTVNGAVVVAAIPFLLPR